jgi:hypothetical protein
MTTADVIAIAKVSQYLWNDKIAKGGFFNNNIDPYKARQLYMERKALQYALDNNLTLEGLRNYVYALCGQNLQVANNIYQAGGVGGNVIIGGGGYGVREYSRFAAVGATSVVFPDAINATLLYASRGGIDVGAITSGLPTGNQVVWDSTTGTLTVAADVPFSNYGEDEFVRILVK